MFLKYNRNFFIERRKIKRQKQLLFKEAEKQYTTVSNLNGSLADYKKALNRHLVSFSEYEHQYEFWNLTEKQRKKFISRAEAQIYYRKLVTPEVRHMFFNKAVFLKRYSQYIHRKWAVVRDMSFKEFQDFTNKFDCIIKPINGFLGEGIFLLSKNSVKTEKLYFEYCQKNLLLEERVKGYDSIQEFHPNSLNTIRVVTISNGKAIILGAFLRMGKNDKIIDNAHAGGIFAQINVDTGIIESEGIDVYGGRYTYHPNSNKKIMNFSIPYWEKIKAVCIKAALKIPEVRFAGWDLCVLENGNIEIIEGNHAPDLDIMQSPLKIGIREKLNNSMDLLFGFTLQDYKNRKAQIIL